MHAPFLELNTPATESFTRILARGVYCPLTKCVTFVPNPTAAFQVLEYHPAADANDQQRYIYPRGPTDRIEEYRSGKKRRNPDWNPPRQLTTLLVSPGRHITP
ncbi:hypothetical protein GCM10009582_34800 [Arthrobacter flavus]